MFTFDIMNQLKLNVACFDCYGTKVSVSGPDFTHVQQALRSFSYFESKFENQVSIKIYLEVQKRSPEIALPLFSFRKAKSYGWSKRVIVYPEDQSVYIQKKNGILEAYLYSRNPVFLNELLYLTLNSLVGWQMESEGWIRLHAMSYFRDNVAVTLFGDSGTGKSTTAVKHLQKGTLIYSDEITLISANGVVHSWPIPIQLSKKSVEELNLDWQSVVPFNKRVRSTKFQLSLVHQYLASPAPLSLVRTPHSLLGAFFRITFGNGLPQILEFQLRADNVLNILKVLTRRLYFAMKLAYSNRIICGVVHEV